LAANPPTGNEGLDMAGNVPTGPEGTRSIPALAQWAAQRFGDAEAIVDGTTRLTFRDLDHRARRAARALIARGVRPGDRVAIWAPNRWEWVVAALGTLGAGAWLVPVNTRFKGAEAADVLERAGVRMLFTVGEFLGTDYPAALRASWDKAVAARLEIVLFPGQASAGESSWDEFLAAADLVDEGEVVARIGALGPDDIADIMFTSGTTGRPKGVLLAHGPSLHAFDLWSRAFGLRRGDRYLIVNPFFHCFGYKAGWMACLLRGATAVPVPVLDVDAVLSLIARERISALPGPPTLFWSLLEHGRAGAADLSSLRIGFVGAATVPAALLRRIRAELPFAKMTTGYGLTEATAMVSITRPDDPPERIEEWSGGVPVPGVEVRVVDAAGDPVLVGTDGEVLVRGFNVTPGYLDDPEATAAAIDPDGWLHTGDIGRLSEGGDLRITDRKKDIYICGGFNVSPAEVEAVLLAHEAVAQAAVVGVPDPRLGEVGAAFVVPRPGLRPEPADLVRWARDRLANYKVPRRIDVVDCLPLNSSGKVLKTELRRWASGDVVRPAAAP
jgi:HIP---CoA ligase